MEYSHASVLGSKVVELLNCRQHKIYVDGTLGLGGHSEQILEKVYPQGLLIGIDQDKDALDLAEKKLARFEGGFKLFHSNFSKIKDVLAEANVCKVDGILLDLGVSSYQIDNKDRGFSFSGEAPLDMRMNQDQSFSAYDLVNVSSEEEIRQIVKAYGEERWNKRIANKIVEARKNGPIRTTSALAKIIISAIPAKFRADKSKEKSLMRTFQAIRIAVNDELGVLKNVLPAAIDSLNKAGRLAVISFHSLEDRIVKNTFKQLAYPCTCPPDFPVCVCQKEAAIKIITSKPIIPSAEEIAENSRSRSAKLRVVEKI